MYADKRRWFFNLSDLQRCYCYCLDVFTHKDLFACISVYRHLIFILFLSHSVTAYAVSDIFIQVERMEHAQADVKNLALQLHLQTPALHLVSSANIKPKTQTDWLQLSLRCEASLSELKTSVMNCPQVLFESTRLKLPFSIKASRLAFNSAPQFNVRLALENGSFSDEAGLHAAERLQASVDMRMQASKTGWNWQADVDWQDGEVFWQPFYIANGDHQLKAIGRLQDDLLSFDHAQLHIKDVGTLTANGVWDLRRSQFQTLVADLPQLNLKTAYPLILKPLLQKTAFADAEVSGLAAIKLEIQNAEPKSFKLRLQDTNIKDNRHKFALYELNADIPWSYELAQQVYVRYSHGALLNLPLGNTDIRATLDRYALTAPEIRLPILDGTLHINNLSAAYKDAQWFWHLGARLEPISLQDFSAALQLTKMNGKASAEIPLVTYAAGSLVTDGSLVLNIFDGTATVSNLTMQTPLGVAPKLNADIALRNLDLGVLTSTFSFGAIEGRLDGDIQDLALQNWKPVRFDAKVQSSPGKYPKKISQRAVENISALGGGGAAAAIQRSFLRFFKQFNYGKMGLSCRLRNDVCEMGGVESTPHGYVIVKGSGIPAISVMGYNKTVGWNELVARIKRVTEGNTKAVIN